VLSGEEEGWLAGLGVLSGIPDADGVVGDLAAAASSWRRVAGGDVRRSVSLPLACCASPPWKAKSQRALLARLCHELKKADFRRDRPGPALST
jgi:exopolyphosphatase/guanosine-5'-triphosphate,3'-diphosphate pyrophosphatase